MAPSKKQCHDCGVREGELHKFGCDMEVCPFCGGQLISCNCIYEQLKLDCSPGTRIYEQGPTAAQEKKWLRLLTQRGRYPYIRYPIVCAGCGTLWPALFMVPDDEWRYYIQPDKQGEVICWPCYAILKKTTDLHSGKPPMSDNLARIRRWGGR